MTELDGVNDWNKQIIKVAVEAQELVDTDRDEKWVEITAAAPGFAEYQEKTSRVIPVIALQRVA